MPLSDDDASRSNPEETVHASVVELLETIRQQYPSVPFLALGQTVFWDEPTKAVWRRLLDRLSPDASLIAGVHDTDYFAKVSAQLHSDQKFAIVSHDDGATRDLWSAAGELSALFGSESIPTRQMFLDKGVPFDWLTKCAPTDKASRYAALTTAWGWRGLVRTDAQNVVACDIPVVDIADALFQLLDWGFSESLNCLQEGAGRDRAIVLVATIRGWIEEYLADCSESCRLSDLYETLLPRFYTLLLGSEPANFETTTSTELFRFNTDTAGEPRFALLNLFLAPETRNAARRAYNTAVARSGIYPLDSFGDGAIPFDLVVPRQGRGTIFVRGGKTVAEMITDQFVEIAARPITSAADLATAVEERFGRRTALVGKAVILADMIAAEHIVVFHETASGYTSITKQFNDSLAASGMSLALHPIVRLTYPTWDALGNTPVDVGFTLPDHLAAAFGNASQSATAFASSWRSVIESQRALLARSRSLGKLRDLLTFLDEKDPGRSTIKSLETLISPACDIDVNDEKAEARKWCDLLTEYEQALAFLRGNAEKSATLRSRVDEHREEARMWQTERESMERRKGEDWRANVLPVMRRLAELEDQHAIDALQKQIDRQLGIRATAFDEPIAILRERITTTKTLTDSFRKERRSLERSPEALQARASIARITRQAQSARLALVRNAYLTVEGLEHTHLRPTSWWLPFVDPSGQWFNAMVVGTSARF